MGRTVVIQFVTLDGVVEDPDGSDGTAFGGWAMRHGPGGIAGDKFRLGELMSSAVLLFGRRTWDHFSTLWPPRSSDFALAMNNASKAVATSRAIEESRWSNSEVVTGPLSEWIVSTRAERDIVVIGSQSVVRSLAAEDLVDEYRLLVFPTVAGAGARLFDGPAEFELISTEQSGPGTLSLYRTHP